MRVDCRHEMKWGGLRINPVGGYRLRGICKFCGFESYRQLYNEPKKAIKTGARQPRGVYEPRTVE